MMHDVSEYLFKIKTAQGLNNLLANPHGASTRGHNNITCTQAIHQACTIISLRAPHTSHGASQKFSFFQPNQIRL